MAKTLKLGSTMRTVPAHQVVAVPVDLTLYITFNRFDLSILYAGTDKDAALDARQMTDDITVRRGLRVNKQPANDPEPFVLSLHSPA